MDDRAAAQRTRIPQYVINAEADVGAALWDVYRANSAPFAAISLPDEASVASFTATSTNYQLPHAFLAKVSSVAQTLCRSQEEIAAGANQFLIYLQVHGEVSTNCAGRPAHIGPGDVAFFDYTREYFSVATDFTNILLLIARDKVPGVLLEPVVHGLVLPAATAAARLIYDAVERLFRMAEGLTPAEAEAAIEAILVLTSGLVKLALAGDDDPREATNNRLREEALAYVDRFIASPDLTPALIARHLKISRSGLYRIFEPLGGVSAVILKRRLDHCMKVILMGAGQSLGSVAFKHGFQSEAHFSRTFRARFGESPRKYLEMVERGDAAWIIAQTHRAGFTKPSEWIDYLGRGDGAR